MRLLRVFATFLILFYGITDSSAQTKTRVTGAANWNTASTWIQLRTGIGTLTYGSTTVSGSGTLFLTELLPGDIVMLDAYPGNPATVHSIQSNTSFTLTSPAPTTLAGAYGRQAVPGAADNVEIGNSVLAGAVNVTLDAVSPTIKSLTFIADDYSHSLTHSGTANLNVTGSVTINQPTADNFKIAWNINGGSATVSGLISFPGAHTYNRIASLVLTSGMLNAYGGIAFSANGTVANKLIDISGGAGVLNLKGSLTTPVYATFKAGTSGSIFNYTDNTLSQSVQFFGAGAYHNLHLNNSSAYGAILTAAITLTNLTGNLRVLSGTTSNGGFAIALNNSKAFEVANGATFKITGSSGMVTGTSITKTFGVTSTVDYNGAAQTVSAETYGTLTLSGSGVKTMPSSPLIIAGDAIMSGTASATALNTVSIGGSVIHNSGTVASTSSSVAVAGDMILNAGSTNSSVGSITHSVGGNWTNNGTIFNPGTSVIVFNGTGPQSINGTAPSQTFNNFTVNKTAGTALSVSGSTIILTVQNLTETTGNFTSPSALNINGNLLLSAGTFIAGSAVNIKGNWTNNGGAFTPGTNTVIFNGTGAQAINGTAASQSFYNIILNKTAGTALSTSGSTTTLTTQDFTQTTGDFTAPALLNINGNRSLSAGVFTAGAITYVKGNWIAGVATYAPGTGTVIFNGSTPQSISGITTFNNLTLNNTKAGNAVTLNNSIAVNGAFTLTDGHLITTSSNILTLGSAATVILNASSQDSSFVKGPMIQTVATTSSITKIFPVGKGKIMHRADITVTHGTAASTQYTGEYFSTSATALGYTLPGTLTKVSDISHWSISKGAGASVAAGSVKLYYFASDAAGDAADLRIAKDNGAGTWTDIGGAGTATGTITSGNNFTSFGRFTLANAVGGSNILPIELLFFSAQLNESIVDITWETASELNSDSFMVERSGDGLNFTTLVKVAAAGYSNQLLHYASIDKTPSQGPLYYRLKQTDYDGTETYSHVVSVYVDFSADHHIAYPNPVIGSTINIKLPGESGNEILVIIRSMNGQEVFSKMISPTSDGTFTIRGAENLTRGVYLLSLISLNRSYQEKLIVQ